MPVVVVGPKGATGVGCVDSSNIASIDARHAAGGYIIFPSLDVIIIYES
jgi:hypothetical protein